jgi:hypothetical protein
MALYWQNNYLNTFDKVVAYYESIKPLVSKHHTLADDLRPIGDRNRKWERIQKVNANCYILQDGWNGSDNIFSGWHYYRHSSGERPRPTEAEMIKLAPIVWRRHKDGTETIKVRNGTGQGAHNSRYSFFARHLPSGLNFIIRNGKHFVSLGHGTEYFLAKSNTVASYDLPTKDQRHEWNKHFTTRDDGVALTFRRCDHHRVGGFEFVDGGKPLPVPPKVRVDKVAKAKMKDAIVEFRDWAFAMYPLLPTQDHEYHGRMAKEVREAMGSGYSYGWGLLGMFAANPDVAKKIIRDPDHELRLHLMYGLMGETDYHLGHTYDTPKEHDKRVKAQFNRHINNICDFNKKTKG